jgi:hypothetical protein
VTADRLKSGMRDSTVRGEGLSRCAAWSLPDGGVLAPGIEATIPFRIREDTDRHYFARHATISPEVVDYLAGLADARCRDLPLYLATGQKYSLFRSLHTGRTIDVSPLVQAERDILYRYAATYAQSRLLDEALILPEGVRAAHVGGQPGIALAVGRLPEAAGDARYFIRRLGEAGIVSAAIEGRGIAYVTAFVIYTPCLDDMLRDGILRLEFSDRREKVAVECLEGVL